MNDAVIISDLHLGCDNCEAKKLSEFLHNIEEGTRRLILNGDVFDSIDFRRLKKHHWHVLSSLRRISDDMEVVWISGNHDGPAEIISHLLGVSVVKEYTFSSADKRVLCLHGDIFDTFLTERPIATWIGDLIYNTLQRLDTSHYWARLAKQSSKHYLRCAEKVKYQAIAYADKSGCDFVCCGHTHHAVAEGRYYNSGCWTEKPCTYLTVDSGEISMLNYDENPVWQMQKPAVAIYQPAGFCQENCV